MRSEETIKARRRARKAKKRKRRIIMFTVEGILLVLVLLFAFAVTKLGLIERGFLTGGANGALDAETLKWMSGYRTIAIFGVDARDNQTLAKNTLADMNMVCSINNDTGEIRLVSVYRDTYVDVNGEGKFNKLNYAYAAGGYQQAVDTLNRNFDLNITEYVTVNWKAVADVVNALNGIDIEITDREFAYINGFITETVEATGVGSVHLTSPGWNHLDGVQAVAYSRLRLMDTDYKRTERQRKVVELTLEKAKAADPKTVLALVDVVFPQILTSLTNTEMLVLAKNINKYYMGINTGFPFEKQSKRISGLGDCVIPIGLAANVSELHNILYDREGYNPSSQVQKLDQQIASNTGISGSGEVTAVTPTQSSGGGGSAPTQGAVNEVPVTEAETQPVDETFDDIEETNTEDEVREEEESAEDAGTGGEAETTEPVTKDAIVTEAEVIIETEAPVPNPIVAPETSDEQEGPGSQPGR